MGLKERLTSFARSKGLSNKAFETSCGLANGFMNKASDNTRKSSLERVSAVFPDLNINWVLTGEGSMLRTSAPSVSQHNGDNSPNVFQQVGEPNSTDANKLYEIIAEKDRQIDRLLSIMEAHVCR